MKTTRSRWTLCILILILTAVFILPPATATEQNVFTVELAVYDNGTVVEKQVDLTDGSPTPSPAQNDHETGHEHGTSLIQENWQAPHHLTLTDDDGTVLEEYRIFFQFFDVTDEDVVQQERVFERIPYHTDATHIQLVRNDETTLHTVNIPERICIDDGTCSPYCDGKGVDPDCDDGTSLPILWILAALLLPAAGIILYLSIEWE